MDIDIAVLKEAIARATQEAATTLFSSSTETFYYFALITSGEAHAPVLSAWSYEKLKTVPEDQQPLVKWSYADSPYFDFGSEYFAEVRRLFEQRPSLLTMDDASRTAEYELRLSAMELGLAEVDANGVFGTGSERERIVINVEVVPPDYTNTERAIRLNPPEALKDWLNEAAE